MSKDATEPQPIAGDLGRLCCPRELTRALDAYSRELAAALAGNLVGIYLCGSLARQCYHPATSDVDIVVVTVEPCSEPSITRILAAHARSGVPIDAIFVTRAQADLDHTPTPIDFALKPADAPPRAFRSPAGMGDWLLIRQDLYECGLAIHGSPARTVIRPVPWQALAASLDFLFPHIVPRFKNPVLMLCRICRAFANRALSSKRTAGEWALAHLDPRWRPLIESSLMKYRSGVADDQGPDATLEAFAHYSSEYIANVRTGA